MKKSDITVCAVKPVAPPDLGLDLPISERENFLKILNHEKPMWMGNQYRTTQWGMCKANQDMPRSMSSATDDWFGCQYIFSEKYGTPTPHGIMFDDITEWEDYVKWPDMDAYVWEASKNFKQNPDKVLATPYGNGIFERMHMFMGFENSLVALVTEPEACKDFFNQMADYKIEIFNRMADIYDYDYVIYNDDWGTAKDTFFSVDTMKDLLLEPTRRIFEAIHKRGVKVEFHNCGHIDRFIPYIIEELQPDMMEIQVLNDIKHIMSTYGDRVTVEYAPDPFFINDPDVTRDQLKAYAREIVDNYGAHVVKGSGVILNINANDPEVYKTFESEAIEYSMKMYR